MVRHMATRTLRHFFLLDWATTVWTDVSHLLRSLLFQKTKGVTPDLNHIAAFEDLLRLCRLAAYEHWPHAMKNGLCAAHFDQGVGWQDAGVFEKVNVCRLLRANLGLRLVQDELLTRKRATGNVKPAVLQGTFDQPHRNASSGAENHHANSTACGCAVCHQTNRIKKKSPETCADCSTKHAVKTFFSRTIHDSVHDAADDAEHSPSNSP